MDTSKEYIKMCEKAEEIQQQSPRIQTRLHIRQNIYICSHAQGSSFFWCLDHFEEDSLGNNILVSVDTIWLPRQDQLQEMVSDDMSTLIYRFGGFAEALRERGYDFASLEQYWIAFLMTDKYAKYWDGEDWIAKNKEDK